MIKVFRQIKVIITKVETNLIKCYHGDIYSRYYYSLAYYIIVYPSVAAGHIQTYQLLKESKNQHKIMADVREILTTN